MAFLLAGALLFNHGSILTAAAAENTETVKSTPGSTETSGDTVAPGSTGTPENILPGADTGYVSGNVPEGADSGIPACLEGKDHEYEELLSEDGTVTGYRCVFCLREIDADTFEKEAGVLHTHVWNREEGKLLPVCTSCGAEYRDCDAQDGYGVHVFEPVEEEGQPVKYRCMFCGAEKEMLEELDLTAELFLQIMGINLMSFSYNGEESSLPLTVAELREAEDKGYYKDHTFNVENLADLLALQTLGNDSFDFAGYTVNFVGRKYADGITGDNTFWDLTSLPADLFLGLGTEEYPFRGTLTSYYTGGSLRFETSTPLLNYVAAGASVSELQVRASINGSGAPVGIIAAHVVPSDTSDTVNLSHLSLSGEVKNGSRDGDGAAGILFGEVVNTGETPMKLCYETEDITLAASVSAPYAGGFAGRTSGRVEIAQTNVFPTGTITGSESAGMLAGRMENGGSLIIKAEGDTAITVNVKGNGINGGLVGRIEQGEIMKKAADGAAPALLTVKGSLAGSIAGGMVGQCDRTKVSLENITIDAAVSANTGSKLYAGGVIGLFTGEMEGAADSGEWSGMTGITITGSVTGGSYAGGAAGYVQGSNLRIGSPDTSSGITVKNTVSASQAAGGVIGMAEGQYIEIYHASVSGGTVNNASSIGGIIGSVGDGGSKSVVKVTDAAVNLTLKPGADNKCQGGIFGTVNAGSMAAMDGMIDTAGLKIEYNTAYRGHIAGRQTEALLYFERKDTCTYDRPSGKAWVDDVGSYGGVYRNGSWGEAGDVISYAGKDIAGTVGASGGSVVLDSEADLLRLAVALHSGGRFAAGSFGKGKAELLAADYLLSPADGSFDLEESGIYTLNRNDLGKEASECFTGSLTGSASGGGTVALKLGELDTYQSYLSLFPYAGGGAAFRNLRVERTLRYPKTAAAGLAVYGENDITVENVDMEMNLTGSKEKEAYAYGGMFAEYEAGAGSVLAVKDSRIGGSMTIGPVAPVGNVTQDNNLAEAKKQWAGGMIAKYKSTVTGDLPGTPSLCPLIRINGLELAGTVYSRYHYTSGLITQINESSRNKDRVILSMEGIHVRDGARLEINDNLDTGGFLGREWYDVAPRREAGESWSLKNLTIGDGTTAAEGPYYNTFGFFGGLVHTVTGRIQLKDINIQNGTFHAQHSGSNHNGLLFFNGYHALIEIEDYQIAGRALEDKEIDYAQIKEKVAVTAVSGGNGYFSDTVGNNINDITGTNAYRTGGVLNIISKNFSDHSAACSNHLQDADGGSNRTRYYYNLFGTSLAGEDTFLTGKKLETTDGVIRITDADQLMIWHLNQYMNDSIRERYLSPYFEDGKAAARNSSAAIAGRIDLAGKSYYPTPVEKCTIEAMNHAEVIFHGKEIMDGTTKLPENQKEHYLLHSGLLLGSLGNVKVAGDADFLTLSGTVSDVGENSGALFPQSLGGKNEIYKVRLKDLYINGYGGEHGSGLMIGRIADGSEVDVSWVETDYSAGAGGMKAASALIGQAGTVDAKKLKLDLTNMKLDDKTDGIFQHAVFIDKNFYTDSTEENEGRIRYLFTKEAYEGSDGTAMQKAPFNDEIHGQNDYSAGAYITIGNELEQGVEYWNYEGSASELLDRITADAGGFAAYLPYVCQEEARGKDIEVNPKNASIIEGCGTYEDPYQISSAKQMLSLSRYLMNKDDRKYLQNWQIHRTNDITDDNGDGICDKHHSADSLTTYGNTDFPTQDELRQAYYLITDDIDFTALASATDRNIAQEFVGLGKRDMPFCGVIVGRKKADGTYPVITLPQKKKDNSCDSFGLIQYAKGAVVKDLVISGKETSDEQLTDAVRVTDHAGSVMACILGGDNIIDGVTVSNRIAVGSTAAAVGGYVGCVRQGSLILRNLKEDIVSGFRCGTLNPDQRTITELTTEKLQNYPYVSGIVGKVENGYVMSEGVSGTVLAHEQTLIPGVYRHSVLPVSNTYDIITAGGMEGAKSAIEIKIKKETAGGTDGFTCAVTNAAQLQLVSMAINSDAFSIYHKDGGYDKQAVCRKAAYGRVGEDGLSVSDPDYMLATKKDNGVYWYPYIYQYLSFDGVRASDSDRSAGSGFYSTLRDEGDGKYYSLLNGVIPAVTETMSYELAHDTAKALTEIDYDLSVYRRGFRGFGATYRVFSRDEETVDTAVNGGTDWVYSDFRANFNGNGATVKAEMINDYDKTIHTTALFNDLVNTTSRNKYAIENLVVTGSFINYVKDRNDNAGMQNANYGGDRAAAVVGMMRRPWDMRNLTAWNVTVDSKGFAAGITAWIDPVNEEGRKAYQFESCQVLSLEDGTGGASSIHTVGGSSGGILGAMTSTYTASTIKDFELTLKDCLVLGNRDASGSIAYVTIENDGNRRSLGTNDQEGSGRGRCGALAGYVGKRLYINDGIHVSIHFQITDTKNVEKDVQYAVLSGGDSTGGVLGEYYGWRDGKDYTNVEIEGITVADSRIEAKNRNESGSDKSFGVGGMIGKLQRAATCVIRNTSVKDTNICSTGKNALVNEQDLQAGGIIGFCFTESKVTLEQVEVSGRIEPGKDPVYEISSRLSNAGGLIGNLRNTSNDSYKSIVAFTDCHVSGMKISSDSRSEAERTADQAAGGSASSVGGLAGYTPATDLIVKDSSVKECVIRSGQNSAGGIIGKAATNRVDTTLENITVDACKIGTNSAIASCSNIAGVGGIYGDINTASNRGTQKLKKITVENCYIYGQNTGGVAGYVSTSQQVGNVWKDGSDASVTIRNNRLFGYYTGGVTGMDTGRKTCFSDVTVDGNTIVALRNDNGWYSAAGGFFGWKKTSSNSYVNLNDIKIVNNRILSGNAANKAYNSAGGMFGYLELGSEIYSCHARLEDNAIGYYDLAEDYDKTRNLLSSQLLTGQLHTFVQTMTEAETKNPLLYSASDSKFTDRLPEKLEEEQLGNYAGYFGRLVGVYSQSSTGHLYFLAPEITDTAAYGGIRTTVEVGSTKPAASGGGSLLAYPYDYRKNIHVVYCEPDTDETANPAAALWGTNAEDRDRLFSQVNAGALLAEYQEALKTKETERLLEAYRLNLSDDSGNSVSDIWEKVYHNETEGYVSPLKVTAADGSKQTLPMIVVDTQYGTTDQLMTSVLALLTGAGGVQNSGSPAAGNYDQGMNKRMKLSVQAMKVEGGVIKKDSGRTPSIKNSGSSNRMEITDGGYDMADDNGDGTFSLLTVTYTQKDFGAIDESVTAAGVKGKTVTLQIPVFVIERLTINTHFKIAEGEVYNAETAKEKGLCTAPLLANDSSYTLYAEYIYGEARNKYSTDSAPVRISKTIGMTYRDETGNERAANFWKGTRLTLIDVCDSDKVYYYTVTGTEEKIRYTDFKDSSGNSYVNKPIHGTAGMEIYSGSDQFITKDAEKAGNTYTDKIYEYENVAVERFLITVDTTMVDKELKENTSDIRDYHITPELEDKIVKRTTLSEHTALQVTRQPGLIIGLVGPGEAHEPEISGSMEEEGKITVNGTFHIEGNSEYWARVLNNPAFTIDSANHYKYLEVAVYLTDRAGNRVKLPDNTNVSINGERLEPWAEEIMPETNLGAYVNRSAVYFYKDGRISFPLDVLKDMIEQEMKDNAGRTKGTISETCRFALSFVNADLTEFTENEYDLHLELLRVEDMDYPAGGEVVDSYVGTVPAARKTELACILEAKDLMELGINTYQQESSAHTIDFGFKLDFNGILSENSSVNGEIAGKYYTVTYRMLEKTNKNGTPGYIPYTGDQLALTLSEPPEGDSQKEVLKGASSTGAEKNSGYITYRFDLSELLNGTDGEKGVVTRDLRLEVKDAGRMDLSNYKIQASVMVSDAPAGDIDDKVNDSLSDFFVFTIAKLKTDLDY